MTSPYKTETRHHPQGKTCHHYVYHRLTCDDYDALRARAAGHCEICGIAEEDTPVGALFIDHFETDYVSFIRGLICGKCNSGVMACIDGRKVWGAGRKWEAKAREYEANSWQRPPPAALALMATRTEMLPKAAQLARRPAFRPIRRESPPRRSIEIRLNVGQRAIADKLRRHLSPEQITRLVEYLTRD